MIRRVTAVLGTMRKPEDFLTYPGPRGAEVVVQSDTRIAAFDPATGIGRLSKRKAHGAYFMHLLPLMGATPIVVPPALLAAFLYAQPKSGDELGPGVTIA